MLDLKMDRRGLRTLLAVLLIAILASPASAIVINDTAGAATAITLGVPHTAIVELFVPAGFCSGTLIDATHILTAQHCTYGTSPGSMTIRFHDGGTVTSYGVTAKAGQTGAIITPTVRTFRS